MASISVVVAVRDEEAMLPDCLRRLSFADELIVVVDDRTTDASAEIAKSQGAVVLVERFAGFGRLKNAGLSAATSDWVFVLDADERVSAALASEILVGLDGAADAYRLRIANYFHGALMRGGGWTETPVRIWRRGWAEYRGEIHELPDFGSAQPRFCQLDHPLAHFSHRSIVDNLIKSANYVDIQAKEMLGRNRRVTPRRLYWTLFREVGFRLVLRKGWRDGVPGVAEALYWPFSNMAAQVRLWELQQSPSLDEVYAELEKSTA